MEWRDWVHYWNHLNQYCDDLWTKRRINSDPNDNEVVNVEDFDLHLQDIVDAADDDNDREDDIFVYDDCEECLRKMACEFSFFRFISKLSYSLNSNRFISSLNISTTFK